MQLGFPIGDEVFDFDVGENADADMRLLERCDVVGTIAAHETVRSVGFGGADRVSLLLGRHAREDGDERRERFENSGLVENERSYDERHEKKRPFRTSSHRACSDANAAGSVVKLSE